MSTRKHSEPSPEVMVQPEVENKLEQPPMYRVFLINDDYTPMDFVVKLLVRFFQMSEPVANTTMMEVHKSGRATCGVYSKDVAETKVQQVNEYARAHQHPLLCQLEQID